MNSSKEWPAEAQARVDEYLDRVERALLEGSVSRTERSSILGEIESQIDTLVARRVEEGAEISVDLVQAVLDGMDPPSSYGASHDSAQAQGAASDSEAARPAAPLPRPARREPIVDPVAIVAATTLFAGAVVAALAGMAFEDGGVFFLWAGLTTIVAFTLALWSISRIRRADGWLHGLAIAYTAACGLPVLVVHILLALIAETNFAIFLAVLVLLALDIAVHYLVIRHFWRRVSEGYNPRPMHSAAPVIAEVSNGVAAGA